MILSNPEEHLIPVYDDGGLGETLKLLFGPDANVRKEWLSGEEILN